MDNCRGLGRRMSSARALAEAATMTASHQELIRVVVNHVEGVIPCDRAAWNEVDLITGIARAHPDQKESPLKLPAMLDHGALPLPLVTHYERERRLPATRLSDVVDCGWKDSASYDEVYRAMGADHQLGIGMDWRYSG